MQDIDDNLASSVDGGECFTIENITIAIGVIEIQGRLRICW